MIDAVMRSVGTFEPGAQPGLAPSRPAGPRLAGLETRLPLLVDTVLAPLTVLEPKPREANLLLTSEAGLRILNPTWAQVDATIRGLDAGHGDSFACLSSPGNTYVQCLRGRNGWHLEWRLSTTLAGGDGLYVHVRGCRHGASTRPAALVKHDTESRGERRDLVSTDEVTAAFRAFHRGEGPIADLEWRDLDL